MAADAPEHLVRGYAELAPGRRALIFCPTVEMVSAVEQAFRRAGLSAASVVGDTPPDARQAIYQQVRTGSLQALVSCAVLTEGFDEPSIDCVMLARPTKSKVLFYQCLGRGLRLWPTKADCLLIDATGATKRHGLLSMAAELGLLVPKTPQEADVLEAGREGEDTAVEPQRTGYRAHDIDLAQRTRLHWVETPKGYWVVNLADRMLRVRPDEQGTYRLEVRKRDERFYTRLVLLTFCKIWSKLILRCAPILVTGGPYVMSITAAKPATTPIPVQLSETEFTAFILPHLSMPKRGPKCKLGYYRVFNLILWVLRTLNTVWQLLSQLPDFIGLKNRHGALW